MNALTLPDIATPIWKTLPVSGEAHLKKAMFHVEQKTVMSRFPECPCDAVAENHWHWVFA